MKKTILYIRVFLLLIIGIYAVSLAPSDKERVEKIINDDSIIVEGGSKDYKYMLTKDLSVQKGKYICLGCPKEKDNSKLTGDSN